MRFVCTIFLCQYSRFSLLFKNVRIMNALSDIVRISEFIFVFALPPFVTPHNCQPEEAKVLLVIDLAASILSESILSGNSLNRSARWQRWVSWWFCDTV